MAKKAKQILIGLMGTIGSGKTTASDYIVKKHKFNRIIMGNLVRAVTRKKGLEVTRRNLLKVQKYYRTRYGENYFIDLTLKKAKDWHKALIDGVRVPADAGGIKEMHGIVILVDAKPEIRFKRLKKRRRKDYSKTFEEFTKEEKLEKGMLKFNTTLGYVDYRIANNSNRKEFYNKIDKLIKRLIK